MRRMIPCLVAALLLLSCPGGAPAGEEQDKARLDKMKLDAAVSGCTLSIVQPNVESYRRRGLEKGHPVSDEELEVVRDFMTDMIRPYCACVMTELSKEYDLADPSFLFNGQSESLKEIMSSGKCPMPVPDSRQIEEMRARIAAVEAKAKAAQDTPPQADGPKQ